MEKKEIKIGNPVSIAGVTLIPVEKVSLNYWHGKSSISFLGIKQPVNLVVISPSAKRAFNIGGEEVPLDQLIQEVPTIKEILVRDS